MTSDSSRPAWKRRLICALVCVLGGMFMALAFPPYDLGNLVWVGLLPLLCVLWTGRPGFRRGFCYAWLYGMGWYCLSFWWPCNLDSSLCFIQPSISHYVLCIQVK